MGQFNVDFTPIAMDLNTSGDVAYVADDDSLMNPTYGDRHGRDRKDLHIFNTSTYAETDHYILRYYIKNNGIICGPDGKIYLLLGEGYDTGFWREVTAKAIGVIIPSK